MGHTKSGIGSLDAVSRRIAHIRSHLDSGFDTTRCVTNIVEDKGDPRSCLLTLSSHAMASAMYAWAAQQDLSSTRRWFYVAGCLDRMYRLGGDEAHSPLGRTWGLLKPLVSNNPALIRWFAENDIGSDLRRVENKRTLDYLAYQSLVALRGEWDRLAQRSEAAIVGQSVPATHKNYVADYAFFLALANRDLPGMQAALQDLVNPRLVRAHALAESGYTEGIISTPAVIYAKIAWYHGLHVEIDTPLIPLDWLPMEPLNSYPLPYDFLECP